jgi:thiol:disulfide interchange protein DsbA
MAQPLNYQTVKLLHLQVLSRACTWIPIELNCWRAVCRRRLAKIHNYQILECLMKIRFTNLLIIAMTLLVFSSFGHAADSKYQAGVHYKEIENAPATRPGRVEVVEAFSYLCTHCATFEPYVQGWKKRKPENVDFVRYPVVFGRGTWELYARAYVTAEVMGFADEAHTALMDKIWKDREVLKSLEELAEFYSGFGAIPDEFIATSKSFAVDAKMRRDQRFLMDAGVNGTPSLVVNGKYLVAGNAAVANYDQMLAVVDYLVAQESATAATVATEANVEDSIEAAVEAKEAADAASAEVSAVAETLDEG